MSMVKKFNVDEFVENKNSIGSSSVQVAIFSHRIENIAEHLKTNKKDFSATRGLLSLVNKRKNLLKYLHRKNKVQFDWIVKRLNLKIKI